MSYTPYTHLALTGGRDKPGFFTPYSSLLENEKRCYDKSFQRAVKHTIGTLTLVQDTVDYGIHSIQHLLTMSLNALDIAHALIHLDSKRALTATQKTFRSLGYAIHNAGSVLGTSFRFAFNLLKETLALATRLLATVVTELLSLCSCTKQQPQDIATTTHKTKQAQVTQVERTTPHEDKSDENTELPLSPSPTA